MSELASTEGGVVVVLFLMVSAIALALVCGISFYSANTDSAEKVPCRLTRLLSGWANIGNSLIHVLLIVYMLSNSENQSEYWLEERQLGGIEGPVFLVVLNLTAGLSALRGFGMAFPIGWNSFVAITGTCLPVVWPRFIAQGLGTWPYPVIFIWFSIFAMELMAVTASLTHFAISRSKDKRE